MTCPTALYVAGLALLVSESRVTLTVALAGGEVTVLPLKVVVAVAGFVMDAAFRSACVIVCVEVQLVEAPGASGPEPQGEIVPCLLSLIENGPSRVTLPELVIVYV